jgi:hypothetical protein
MIAQMDDTLPNVAAEGSRVRLLALADGQPHGFLLSREAAFDTAVRLLAAATDGTAEPPLVRIQSIAADEAIPSDGSDIAARITVRFEGAAVAFILNPAQVTKLAAGLAATARKINRPLR